jgi:small subunit ribosomal protein S1
MDELLKESSNLQTPRRGEIRIGTIAKVSGADVLVDIGAKSEGVIPAHELEKLPQEQRDEIVVGKEVTVYVVRSSGRDDGIVLSLVRAEEEQDWAKAEELRESAEPYSGEVAGYNKGGLIVKVWGLRGFLPASQVSLSRRRRARGETPDKRWGSMVGETIVAKVVEVDRRRNRLILSERAAAREARDVLKERLISELEVGEIRSGHVISLADFGAFVDIGGADGLVHTSELTWKRISHPREVVKVGDKVKVKVLALDAERKRISLSMRELEEDPWEFVVGKLKEGQLVEGTITKLTKFGAFASLSGLESFDIEGLIHISELSDQRIGHPREVVQEGQELALRVIHLDLERRRIGLSLIRVDSPKYADQDWQAAMREMAEQEEDEAESAPAAEAAVGEEAEPAEEEPSPEVVEAEDAAPELEAQAEASEPEAPAAEASEPPEEEAEEAVSEAEEPLAEASETPGEEALEAASEPEEPAAEASEPPEEEAPETASEPEEPAAEVSEPSEEEAQEAVSEAEEPAAEVSEPPEEETPEVARELEEPADETIEPPEEPASEEQAEDPNEEPPPKDEHDGGGGEKEP